MAPPGPDAGRVARIARGGASVFVLCVGCVAGRSEMSKPVGLSREGLVGVITIDRAAALNAFDLPMAEDMAAVAREVGGDDSVRCVVLRGAGKHFCAGGDLEAIGRAHDPSAYVVELARTANVALEQFRSMRKPVLAELKGAVAGGGVGVALSADLRIASDTTKFSLAFLKVGLTPDMGATWALPRTVGRGRAFEMAAVHDPIGAPQALAWGLVNRVVPQADLETRCIAWARELAELPPLAVGELKALFAAGESQPFSAHIAHDSASISRMAGTEDFREGVKAFFEKRPAKFRGR